MSVEPALLSRQQLAEMSGFTVEEVGRCEATGIIAASADGYRGVELIKLQMIHQVAEVGGGLERCLEAYNRGGFSLGFLESVLPRGIEFSNLTYCDLLEHAGIPEDELVAVLRAVGLPLPELDQRARVDEVAVVERLALIRALPIPLDARLHALRVMSDGFRRAAEVQVDLFQDHVQRPLMEAYTENLPEAHRLISEVAAAANPTVSALATWIYQRFLEFEILKDVTNQMERAASGADPVGHRAKDPVIAFIDLAGFTAFSAREGDREAAVVAEAFSDMVLDITRAHGGRVVKMLGDGAMLMFEHGEGAVRASLELVAQAPTLGLPPLRAGLNRGPVVAQAGDYYGSTVNIAARINDYARPREVLVSDKVIPGGGAGIELEEIGEVGLKNVPRPVRLYRARATGAPVTGPTTI
jgi:adenylate cyclase